MKTYIALLRGINVGGHKKIKMAELRTLLEKLPFENVETYIQSGNIVFNTAELDTEQIENSIKKKITETFGFEVSVLALSALDLEEILQKTPFTDPVDLKSKRIYYVLLKDAPAKNDIPNLEQENYPNELFEITSNCLYLNCKKGAGIARLTNTIIENKLKVAATTRNHRTMMKLLEMAKK